MVERCDELANLTTSDRIQAGHRLIQKDDLRLMEYGLRNACALQHAL